MDKLNFLSLSLSLSACKIQILGRLKSVRVERERERKFNLSIQPALAYEDVSMLESSAKLENGS